MSETSTLKVWDLGGTAATKDDLDGDANAERVAGTEHVFTNDSDILVDMGSVRFQPEDSGTTSDSPNFFAANPVTSDSPTWENTFQGRVRTDGDTAPTWENTRLVENTSDVVALETLFQDGTLVTFTFHRGSLSIQVEYERSSTLSSNIFHGVSGGRWGALDDGKLLVDGDEHTSNKNVSGPSYYHHSVAIGDAAPWLVASSTSWKADNIQGEADGDVEHRLDSAPEKIRQWWHFIPTTEPDQGTDQYHHETFSLSGSGSQTNTKTVNFGNDGRYYFAAAVTSTDGQIYSHKVELDDDQDSTFEDTLVDDSNPSEDDYSSSSYAHQVVSGAADLKVTVDHGGTNSTSTSTVVWWPYDPDSTTADSDFFSFANFVVNLPLAARELKRKPVPS